MDAALEKATFLFTVFGKFGLFLEEQALIYNRHTGRGRKEEKKTNFTFMTGTYVLCTLLETLCVVRCTHVFPVPREGTDIGKPIRFFPSRAQAFCTLCKVLQHLWVHPVIEVAVMLELLDLVQFLLSEGRPVVVHIIGFPFLWVLVTVWDQATVVPILVYMLLTGKQLTCPNHVLLVFQFEVLTNKQN